MILFPSLAAANATKTKRGLRPSWLNRRGIKTCRVERVLEKTRRERWPPELRANVKGYKKPKGGSLRTSELSAGMPGNEDNGHRTQAIGLSLSSIVSPNPFSWRLRWRVNHIRCCEDTNCSIFAWRDQTQVWFGHEKSPSRLPHCSIHNHFMNSCERLSRSMNKSGALPPKADINQDAHPVRFVPKANICSTAKKRRYSITSSASRKKV
jgi:hypothetical protein